MKRALLILLSFSALSLFSQSKIECDKILSQEINLNFEERSDLDVLNHNFSKLKDCGLEQIDIDFLANGPILATLLVPMITRNDGKITYQNLFDKVLEIKQLPQYNESIELYKNSVELSKRSADIKNWEIDKKLLEALETPQEMIDRFHIYLQENSDPNQTYAEAFKDFRELSSTQENNIYNSENEYEHGIFKNPGNVNYDELRQKSIELHKPLLLYFTGYACVNCRKMEEYVLSDKIIKDQLQNDFYFVNFYVDDKSKLSESDWFKSKITNKIIKTVGAKHSELQMTKFKVNAQPYFVIIDAHGNAISNSGYTPDIKIFANFLKSAN